MLNFVDVAVRRGPRLLFAGVSFGLFRGEKVGITGENGSGKSTLLELVRGTLHADAGVFEMPGNLVTAHVSQDIEATEQPAIEFVLDGDHELRAIEAQLHLATEQDDGALLGALHARYAEVGGYDARARAAQLMHGLGFAPDEDERPIRAFSGGWRVRINVARALMCRSDLLLLDEPTNHLDIDAILWLENWLRAYPGTLLLIAHDREFLDRVCNRIVNIEHQRVRAYRGNYSAFETQRAAELAEHSALYARQQREIRHMESFVERFRAQASKARQAQSRLKALERMQRIAPAHVDSAAFEFAFAQPARLPRPLLAIDEQSAGYGGVALLRKVKLTLMPGDRLALLGKNGAGKSTCMKMLAGELDALGGSRTEARGLRIGYFAQHHLEQLAADDSPLGNLRRRGGERAVRAPEAELRDYLATFGFRDERVFEPVGLFSGGEKARLVLALVAFQRPNLLLLDEPTNHLDLEMRQALAVALQEYAGAVVLVSHDRHLLNTVADELMVVHDGKVSPFDGDLEDYARWLANAGAVPAAPAAPVAPAAGAAAPAAAAVVAATAAVPVATAAATTADQRRKRRREGAAVRDRLAPLRATVVRHEQELERLARERVELEHALAAPEMYRPDARAGLQAALARQAELSRRCAEIEAAWFEASAGLEAAIAAGANP
jgi:ATP-binding cassette, subfamily F, member 3